jgi:hypothetical protein
MHLILASILTTLVAAPVASPAPQIVDDFEASDAWTAMPADGVEMRLSTEAADPRATGDSVGGRALRVDFRFVKGGGYAVLRRPLDLDLPENYRFTFRVRGECLPQNLEFKLIDFSGANVWWQNRRDFTFPRGWETLTVRKRQVSFAWGPAGGGEIRRVAALEFAITAGSGGSGTVWLDDLTLTPLPPPSAEVPPLVASASSALGGHGPARAVDGDPKTWWESLGRDRLPWLELDLGVLREFGGLVVDWVKDARAAHYAVESSPDRTSWRIAREVTGGGRARDYLDLPDREARYIRLRALSPQDGRDVRVREVRVMPLEWASSPESFFRAIAGDAPRGTYPRAIAGEQSFWTVVGVDAGRQEGLLNQDGMLETGKAAFSVEPFLHDGDRLVTWADVRPQASLEEGRLPIPSVRWQHGDLELTVTAFADGPPGASNLIARYRVRNLGMARERPTLFLALRPFQVNPPAQFLGTPGGTARLGSIIEDGRVIRVDGDRGVVSLTVPDLFGAATFGEGDVVADFLREGLLPPRTRVTDPLARASAALAYRLDLDPREEEDVHLLIPLESRPVQPQERSDAEWRDEVEARLQACREAWRKRADRLSLILPGAAAEVARAVQAQLGWILVNRDSAGIQPGSRSYERSWIRDGSLTSAALLRTGHPEVVREFLEWFAPYQYENGKVPCCVDHRGSDPVPEHDSSGEFIFLVAEYFRHTGDRALVERLWPAVVGAADYLDSLRQMRRTAEWRDPREAEFFGLLPPSISHEGYSAKPMHSYWDDFFALRGFKDAVYLASVLGRAGEERRLAAIRDEFQADLEASIQTAMQKHRIDYVPGCADLGDFDATSTTIALDPVQAEDFLPRAVIERTFERYWEFFRDRRDGRKDWEAFTPYEVRNIGAFVRLGWRERADSLLRFFLEYRRPPGWQQWPEVVWSDEPAQHFIGDLPHTWVGSDLVRSVLDMLAYEREADSALVIGAGVPRSWVVEPPGLAVRGLGTRWGPLAFTMRSQGAGVEVRIEEGLRVPPSGLVLRPPGEFRRATVDGTPATIGESGEVVVRSVPATVVFER